LRIIFTNIFFESFQENQRELEKSGLKKYTNTFLGLELGYLG